MLRSWRRLLSPRPTKRLQGAKTQGHRLFLEALEERSLLAAGFVQTNLVSDLPGLARLTDPNLVNPWGISLGPTGGNIWVSDNATGVTTLYRGDVNGTPLTINSLVVTIPGGAPTGQVFNSTNDFVVHSGAASAPALFIFASESGEITGWNPGVPPPPASTNAQVGATTPGAVYKGLAIGNNGTANFLYAANFNSGKIDVFDKNFQPATLAGTFTDPNIPAGFAPFNIEALGGRLIVTFAKQDDTKHDDVSGPGNGFVDTFDFNGNLLGRLVSNGPLNSPWGMTMAPANFGSASGDLLISNFGDGRINVFNPTTGAFLGPLQDVHGNPIAIDRLWGLAFGNGNPAGSTNALYFSAGIADESHGLFGSLRAAADQPLAGAATTITPVEGTAFTGVVASFTDGDPAAQAADFTAMITWGDGHTSAGTIAANASGGFAVSGTNTYSLAGVFPVSVVVTDTNTTNDPGGSTVTIASSAHVGDAPLAATGMDLGISQGLTVSNAVVATFTDAGGPQAVGHYTATINWGDGTASIAGVITVAGTTFSVAGNHTYGAPGRRTITVSIADTDGSTASASANAVVGGTNQRFVSQVYLDLLQHLPDANGLAFWSSLLTAGATRSQVVAGIESTQEYRRQVVGQVFSSLLHRTPDQAGLTFFDTFLGAGGKTEQVEALIAGSAEFFQTQAGGTNAGFVSAIFQNFLHRAPDAATQTMFLQELTQGASRGQVATQLLNTSEFRQVLVGDYFQRFLNRPADPAGSAALANLLAQGATDETVIALILSSNEFLGKL